MFHKHSFAIIRLIGPLLVLPALLSCGKRPPESAGGPRGKMHPAQVSIVEVKPATIDVTYDYAAQIAGFKDVEIRARVTGILQKRLYQEGGPVKSGQSLFQIDAAPFQTVLARAQANLASAEARAAQAERNLKRVQPLQETRAVSQREIDDAASLQQVAAAEVRAARTQVNEAQLNLRYTRVESPVTGIAGRSLKSEGSLVSGPDVLLTTVSQVDRVYVIFGIPDSDQLAIRKGIDTGRLVLPADKKLIVNLKLGDGSTYGKTGKVDFSDIRINTLTGTVEARADLPNPDMLLRPGQFARVELSGAQRPAAIVVPQRAVLEGPKGKFVYTVNTKSAAEPRPVKVGAWQRESWVIEEGLHAGDRVIVDGVMKIGPGAPVKVVPAAAAPAAPAP